MHDTVMYYVPSVDHDGSLPYMIVFYSEAVVSDHQVVIL